jgi:hypothetical protein
MKKLFLMFFPPSQRRLQSMSLQLWLNVNSLFTKNKMVSLKLKLPKDQDFLVMHFHNYLYCVLAKRLHVTLKAFEPRIQLEGIHMCVWVGLKVTKIARKGFNINNLKSHP